MLCFVKTVLQRFMSYTRISHTDVLVVCGGPTLTDVERFRNGPVHEPYSLKASQMCKVHTSSHEITDEPYVSSNYDNSGKTGTADVTTNYDAETNTSLADKITMFVNTTSTVAPGTTATWIRILTEAA